MNKKGTLVCFVLFCILQLALPVYYITRYEAAILFGHEYKFRVHKYEEGTAQNEKNIGYIWDHIDLGEIDNVFSPPVQNQEYSVFLTIKEDKNGYAKFDKAFSNRPFEEDYVEAKAIRLGNNVSYITPLQSKASYGELSPLTEKIYFQDKGDIYISLRVLWNTSVVTGIYSGGVRLENLWE